MVATWLSPPGRRKGMVQIVVSDSVATETHSDRRFFDCIAEFMSCRTKSTDVQYHLAATWHGCMAQTTLLPRTRKRIRLCIEPAVSRATGLRGSFKGRVLQLVAKLVSGIPPQKSTAASTGRAEGIFAWQMQI